MFKAEWVLCFLVQIVTARTQEFNVVFYTCKRLRSSSAKATKATHPLHKKLDCLTKAKARLSGQVQHLRSLEEICNC